jgi:hypothetical protein
VADLKNGLQGEKKSVWDRGGVCVGERGRFIALVEGQSWGVVVGVDG